MSWAVLLFIEVINTSEKSELFFHQRIVKYFLLIPCINIILFG